MLPQKRFSIIHTFNQKYFNMKSKMNRYTAFWDKKSTVSLPHTLILGYFTPLQPALGIGLSVAALECHILLSCAFISSVLRIL